MSESYEHVLFEISAAGVARLTLNDPKRRNAWTCAMRREAIGALATFSANNAAKVLVLSGAGGSFCSGGNLHSPTDIELAESRTLGHAAYMRESMHALVLALHRLEKPSIAMIDGLAVAGGLALALLCDFRIASDRARLGDRAAMPACCPTRAACGSGRVPWACRRR
jgi:2-(1,2-epoxy-1,2-dihydrophenyl)acetyl-CoA isomerase